VAKVRNDARPSHVYPLGENHIICLLQPNRNLTILELRTLQELQPNDNISPLVLLRTNQSPSARASFGRGFVTEFGVSRVIQTWQSGTPLPEWACADDEDTPLSGLSPDCTRIVTFYGSPRRELRVKNAEDGTVLANQLLGDDDLEMGEVYDVTFDSDTKFHLKIDGPGRHVQIPHEIIPSSSGPHSHTISKGEPVPFVRTPGNTTVRAGCKLRMGRRRRVQEDLLDITRECTERRRWTFLGWSVARHGWG
jgi:hypothetical protein